MSGQERERVAEHERGFCLRCNGELGDRVAFARAGFIHEGCLSKSDKLAIAGMAQAGLLEEWLGGPEGLERARRLQAEGKLDAENLGLIGPPPERFFDVRAQVADALTEDDGLGATG